VTTEKKKPTSKKGSSSKGQRKSSKKAEKAPAPAEPLGPSRVLVAYREEIAPQLFKEFEYTSAMQTPRLEKIVLNIGIGAEAITNRGAIEAATKDLVAITGQIPITTKARKSIAGFKIRDGMPMGLKVTLRGRRMYEFFDRFVSSSLPRIRDFRGLSRNAFDGRGNYAVGISEQVIFPEIDYNSIDRLRGLQVVITTTAVSDREGFRFLELMGMPFARTESDTVAA
jgi:large subunit ribosomal protein L5